MEQTSSSDQNKGQGTGAAELQNSSSNSTALVVGNPTANYETKKKKKREKPLPPSPVIQNTVHKTLVRQSKHQYIQLIDNADEHTTCFPDIIAMTLNQLTKNQSTISYNETWNHFSSCMGYGYRDNMNDLRDVNQLLKHYNYFNRKHPNFGQGKCMVLFSKTKGTFIARIGFFKLSKNSQGQLKPEDTQAAVFFAEEGWFADTHNVMDFLVDSADPLTNRLAQKMIKEKSIGAVKFIWLRPRPICRHL
jgi:hypothetical protein